MLVTSAEAPRDGLRSAQDEPDLIDTTAVARSAPVIRLRDAAFGYDRRPVISGVDLDIDAGETVAVLGANGSGKSTLVKGLLGISEHLGGEVELFGEPLMRFRQRFLLGYVPQRHTLSAAMRATVSEIVAIGRLPHLRWAPRLTRADRRIVADAIDIVGLGGLARHDVSTLSGGQQRRVLIARALASQPEVLVMDEPTAGVDVASQRLLVDVIARLVDDGATLLVVTHEVAALAPVLRRAITVEAGRVVADRPLDPRLAQAAAGWGAAGWTATGFDGGGPGHVEHTDPGHCHELPDASVDRARLAPSYPTQVPHA